MADCRIAYAAHLYDGGILLARNYKLAVLVGCATRDEAGVSGIEQADIGIFDGAVASIYDTACHLGGSFLRTFDNDSVAQLRHLDGIETYQLTYGIGDTHVMDALGNLKIFQLIVHKVDGILVLGHIQVFQCRSK